ncbi:MAG: hypothetical protein HN341_18955 [Verrucomicrobia bacterium]|jgi:hypothetical protein|nr:hypothetical protein [Verrucomicrobiota bacterium]
MSKRFWKTLLPFAVIVAIVTGAVGQVTQPASDKLRVRKLTGLGNKGRVFTPSFSTDMGGGIRPSREWQAFTVTYDTAPEWIDELLIQFHVLGMTVDPETKRNAYSLYKVAVRYMDIEQDRNHMAITYLRPSAIKRYGEAVAIAAIFTLDGAVVAEVSDEGVELPPKWWENPRVIDSPVTTVREGYLLNRKKSPWALINSDDYEVIK